MERPNKVFCLFEQSGTFKNAFKKLGIDAEDYDIKNEYGETDHQIDLFEEIEIAVKPVREIFVQDPRINPSHTFVYPDTPYWDSHCLNKDVATIADNPKAYLLRQIINFNNQCKKSLQS